MMFHCLSVPPGNKTCWRQRWNKPGWNNLAALKNQPSQAPKSKNQHFCLEFTAYPSQTDHVNRPCNPQRDPCWEQQRLTGPYSWAIPLFIRTSQFLGKVLSWISTGLWLSGAVPHTESPGHSCSVPSADSPTRNMGSSASLPWICEGWDDWKLAQSTNGCKLFLKSQRRTPKALLPWIGAK